jgi:4-amino-4-deoxy-L-arabinose transferase-like glycosyltransferase
MDSPFKKHSDILIYLTLAVLIYFIDTFQFIKFSMGLHPDNIQNVNIHTMIAQGINPNQFASATARERELFNYAPLFFVFFAPFYKIFNSAVSALAFINYLLALGAGISTFFIARYFTSRKTALLAVLTFILSVWAVLVFRLNFSAYIALPIFSLFSLYFYWRAVAEKSTWMLFFLCLTVAFGVVLSTWPVFLTLSFCALYTFFSKDARSFIFTLPNLLLLLLAPSAILILSALLGNFLGAEGSILKNYYEYFFIKRYAEHGGEVSVGTSLLQRPHLFYLMLTNYYEAICTLWGHQRVQAPQIQLMNPLFWSTAVLGIVSGIIAEHRKGKFLALYALFCVSVLVFCFIPNERYFIIVVPVLYLLSAQFLTRVVEIFPFGKINRNLIYGAVVVVLVGVSLFNLKTNYLLYNRIINSYIVGGADRRRHGIEETRQYLKQMSGDCSKVYFSYNASNYLISLDNYYQIPYLKNVESLNLNEFASMLAVRTEADSCFVYVLSRYLPNSEAIAQFLIQSKMVDRKTLTDIENVEYLDIYFRRNGVEQIVQ